MPNPLSEYGVSDTDFAMAVGMTMGEAMHEGLVGMGIIAATALNRAQNPSAYLSRSAALGDVFAAPFSAGTMIDATRQGRSLPGAGRQFSPTFNSNIKGASTAGHQNFKAGMEAALAAAYDPSLSPSLGIRQEGYMRAQKAVEVAVKARDMGIDIGLGVEHFSAPGFERQAGVGRNRSSFGGHSLSPTGGWSKGVKAPTEKEFASRFAAAAALTGVEIPDDMVQDITAHVGRADIMAAASIVQREAQDYLSKELEQDVMPGLNYSDLVQRTGLEAIDVPDVTGQLGIAPIGARGFADNFGITPNDGFSSFPADPIGQVDFGGYLDPVGPSPIDGPTAFTGTSSLAPAGAFSNQALGPSQGFTSPDAASLFDGVPMGSPQSFDAGWTPGYEGFNAPGLIDQASFDARFNGAIPEHAIETGYPEVDLGITSPGALRMGETFGIEADAWGPGTGFSAGVDGGPYGFTPDASAPSLEARNAMDRAQGSIDGWNGGAWNSSDLNSEAIASRVNAELGGVPASEQQAYDRAMAEYSRDQAKYERDLAAYNAATKSFSATPTGFNTDVSSLAAPVASGLNSFGLSGFTNPATGTMVGPALATPSLSRPTLPSKPEAPIAAAPVRSASVAPSYSPAASLPETAPLPPARPEQGLFSGLPSFEMPTIRDIGSTLGFMDPIEKTSFMDAMSNIDYARAYQPSVLDGWKGAALKGAAFGALTGGIPGAVMGGVWGAADPFGRITDRLGNAFGGWFNGQGFDLGFGPAASWDTWDPSTYGFGDGFNSRGERSHTGQRSEGATVGDGSYSERSGENPNNPQGIL
jgi:hypothetical protein